MSLLIGIDIGTASSKGVLVRSDGTVVATAVRPHAVDMPRAGWFEHDAVTTWWADFCALAGELAARADGPLGGLAVSGIGPCLLPADEDGQPLRPAILYGVDTRATAQIAAQNARFGPERVLERCHAPLTSQAIGPKMAWLADHEPDVRARTRRWFMASSYLTFRLTGRYVLDHHSASQSVPLYAPAEHGWNTQWCELIAPGVEFPELAWSTEVIGEVTPAAAGLTGLPAGLPVLAGTVDAWAEAASVGVTRPGDMMVMYGTTMFLVAVTERPYAAPGLWGTVGTLPGTSCLAAGMATSGAITGWLAELTGADYAELTAEAARTPPGAEGLLMLPYFAGERTPLFDPYARGVLTGLTLQHGRGHLYRAALEGIALGVRHNLDTMRAAGADPRRLVAVGGGTNGGLWTSIVSDVLGRPQEIPVHTVGAAYGDAFLAALALGLAKPADITAWNPTATTVTPDPARHRHYAGLYPLYRELYESTRPLVHTLAGARTPAGVRGTAEG